MFVEVRAGRIDFVDTALNECAERIEIRSKAMLNSNERTL